MTRDYTTGELQTNAKARLLARLMSDLSEEYWCAGWLSGCEYALWADLTGSEVHGHKGWGISAAEKEELKTLHQMADGWVIWSEQDRDEKFLTTDQWLAYLEAA